MLYWELEENIPIFKSALVTVWLIFIKLITFIKSTNYISKNNNSSHLTITFYDITEYSFKF